MLITTYGIVKPNFQQSPKWRLLNLAYNQYNFKPKQPLKISNTALLFINMNPSNVSKYNY